MNHPAVRRAMAVVAVVMSLAACKDNGSASPPVSGATVPTAAPTTTTTNPYAVPAVIDATYVNRVLAGLDVAIGDVNRIIDSSRSLPPEAIERLKGIYGTGSSLQLSIDLIQDDLRRGLAGYKSPPGDPKTTVDTLLSGTPTCLHARVLRDYSAVATRPNPPSTLWVTLLPTPPGTNTQYNPTSWYLAYDGFEPGRVAPRNPCVA